MSRSKLFGLLGLLCLVSLLLGACGDKTKAEPTPTPDDSTLSIDIAGTYNILGANPDTSEYGCMLDVTPDGDVYQWYWSACGEFDGVGLSRDNVVAVAWGGDECRAATYRIQEDGALSGRWANMGQNTLGAEQATPTDVAEGDIAGTFDVSGVKPDGSEYEGKLTITASGGDVYQLAGDAGGEELSGVGIREDDILSVAYGGENCSVLSYLVHDDGTLNARWAYVGYADLGTEKVTPVGADAGGHAATSLDPITLPEIEDDTEPRPSAGCGASPAATPGETETVSIVVGDLERVYLLYLPSGYDPNTPASLVLSFHGYTGAAGDMVDMNPQADKHGYIGVYPQGSAFASSSGMITSWNDLSCNASPGPEGPICADDASPYAFPPECGEPTPCNWCTCHDDLAYIDQMLDELEQNLCIDLNRVYAMGMSNGGMFEQRLGCDMADRFAAVAPIAGTLAKGFNCAPDTSTPIAIMNIHGSQDDYVDVSGKQSSDGYRYTAMADVMAAWSSAESQDCDQEVTVYTTVADGMRDMACTQNANCATGAEVVSCWWDAGHAWPGGSNQFGYEMMWEFFRKHSKKE